jgi:hypothetical protein
MEEGMISAKGMAGILGFLVLLLLSVAVGVNAEWVNATGNLAGQASECGDLQSIWAVPGQNMVITGVANNGIYGTTDGGATWTKQSGSAVTFRMLQMAFDPVDPNTWYACGIYHSPGVAKTTNGGSSWTGLGNTYHHDGFSVDFSDPNRQLLLAGTHENSSTLWKSSDGGQNWSNIGCPGGGNSCWPLILDTQTWLMGIQNNGIHRTTNGGSSWTQVTSTAPKSAILKSSAGDLYVNRGGTVMKGSPDGTSWSSTTMPISNDLAMPIELPDGKIASINNNGVYISDDKGATYTTGCRNLPSAITGFWGGIWGFCYNEVAGAFYTFYWKCSDAGISSDQIWRFDTLVEGSTALLRERRASVSAPEVNLDEAAAVFDMLGRRVDMATVDRSRWLHSRNVYFVRMPDGAIVRQVRRAE